MIKEHDAVEIISLFRSKGIKIYLDGGWGVDALVGVESRIHNDIDIFIEKQDKECAINLLRDNGYSKTVMEYTTPDHTVWRDGNVRIIDLHIFSRNFEGDLVFEGETFSKEVFSGKGRIGNLEVNCITPEWQVIFHTGYQLDENDIADVLLLCNKFDLSVPDEIARNFSIDTNRLTLRRWRDDDAEALYRYASDPDVGPIAGWSPHGSVENSLEIIRTVFAAPETYAVVLKETNEPIGCCGIMFSNSLHTAKMQPTEAEIGYWIGKPYWGQGLIPEAVKALLSRCFNDLGLGSVWCGYYEGNNKSKRVCEKCGFKYHHTNHDIVSPLGDKRNEHFYLMTKEDYHALYINRER